jgi:hypothetical protein
MTEKEPNYAEMPLLDLLDVAQQIDRHQFPDRWNRLSAEIAARRSQRPRAPATIVVESRRNSPELGTRSSQALSPLSRKHAILAVAALAAVALAFAVLGAVRLYQSHFWRGPDVQFGDQHLKTAVALIELHHVRFGRYPDRLSDLQFVGDWDRIALNSVSYRSNAAGTRYCVQVERGWIAKPQLTMPPLFWKGTGYDAALCK